MELLLRLRLRFGGGTTNTVVVAMAVQPFKLPIRL
jgi:hypothetical protein